MKKLEFNTNLLNQYLNLLSNLSVNAKRYLIEKLSNSISHESNKPKETINLFGAWASNESSSELLEFINSNRIFNQSTENFD